VRLFLAIPVEEEILRSLERGVSRLRESRAAVRWVRPEAIHQTIKFLGETRQERVDTLIRSTTAVCDRFQPFPISVTGLGAYPDPRRPRVIWAGVRELSGSLQRLWKSIEETTEKLGWLREKRGFSPHITLGRVKGSINLARLSEIIMSMENEHWGDQEAGNLVLYHSRLNPDGARYEKVHVFPLGKSG
jgi:2'-5' RNA ligase